MAILYLQALIKTGQEQKLDVDALLGRLQKNLGAQDAAYGLTPSLLHDFQQALVEKKLSKSEQARQLLQQLMVQLQDLQELHQLQDLLVLNIHL